MEQRKRKSFFLFFFSPLSCMDERQGDDYRIRSSSVGRMAVSRIITGAAKQLRRPEATFKPDPAENDVIASSRRDQRN